MATNGERSTKHKERETLRIIQKVKKKNYNNRSISVH